MGTCAVGVKMVERKAIEVSFPLEALSDVAQLESWRKEINRPVYHMHKWWAQRLGSVFRAIVIGSLAPEEADILDLFYKPTRFPEALVYDPFMGSGTTIGEAHKLGCRVIGRDINPVSYFIVKTALQPYSRAEVADTFQAIEGDVAPLIKEYYRARVEGAGLVDVLYYFWVMVVQCPLCQGEVNLFSRRVFAQHAYPARQPGSQAICPSCWDINEVQYRQNEAVCPKCGVRYNPQEGPARGQSACCPHCECKFAIARAVQAGEQRPTYRMYAKLVLYPDGRKEYLGIDDFDRALFQRASEQVCRLDEPYPVVPIEPGYNTDQARNYNFRHWHDMFNSRQLLCLGLLAARIRKIEDERLRYLFSCLFSGCLEFNNMFCSYKGEGTGAVRHMFAHHILKPERTPLEANLWGTPKSSGSFSTLFETRVLRALRYRQAPFELQVAFRSGRPASKRLFGLSQPMGAEVASDYDDFVQGQRGVYLSCGTSSQTDIAAKSVDAVITDPPFFDNVHYSELADFFYVWQRHILGTEFPFSQMTTRSELEVQNADAATFAAHLATVFAECHRVLRDGGLLVFTYHHSRKEGWTSVLSALAKSGFYVGAAYPVKSEMSVAMPKHQAAEPIDFDAVLVCRKRAEAEPLERPASDLLEAVERGASDLLSRFNQRGRKLSRNDVGVFLMARALVHLSRVADVRLANEFLTLNESNLKKLQEALYLRQFLAPRGAGQLPMPLP
jgi:putative DNA methylase